MNNNTEKIIANAIIFDLSKKEGRPIEKVLDNLQFNSEYHHDFNIIFEESKKNYLKMIGEDKE